jgi:ABC-type transporter Mla subunit MlaD
MALQDLTPQLRTRLSRMEKAVGWFVLLATVLLLAGFGYYIYNTAARKGWFLQKVTYQTSLNTATGLKVGDPVMLMGFNVGEITKVEANEPWDYFGVTIDFRVKQPYFGYIWTDSKVKAAAADFLGGRVLEISKGSGGVPTVLEQTNKLAAGLLDRHSFEAAFKSLTEKGQGAAKALVALNQEAKNSPGTFYKPLKSAAPYWLQPAESPAATERLDQILNQVEKALPNVLRLTNDLALVLQNSVQATSNLNLVAASARPAADNLASLSAQLRGPGALGEWLLPAGGPEEVSLALTNANALLANTDTNLTALVAELGRSLDNLANITSNLNSQVQANTNLVTSISDAIVHTDGLVQGLKRHWLLRSAFKTPKTNAPPALREGTFRAPNDPFRE